MKALKTQNKMFSKIANKTITHQRLNNIKKIKKESYDSLISKNSIASSDLESSKSSIFYLSDLEEENPLRREVNKMDHVVITDISSNQLNDVIENELKFDSRNSLAKNTVKYPLPKVSVILRGGKDSRQNLNSGITLLWDSGATNRMIKRKNMIIYKSKLRANKFKYNTDAELYTTTHNVKVPFLMLEISIINIITHRFHIYNTQGDEGIGYDISIGRDLMVQLSLKSDFGYQLTEWCETMLPMNIDSN